MGRLMPAFVAGLLCVAGLSGFAASYPQEGQLLVNPGFEIDEDGDGVPDGWSTGPDRARLRETVFMGGNNELVSVGETYVLATQDITLEPGETYTISFQARGSGGGLAGTLIVHGEEQPLREMPLMWNVAVDEDFAEYGRSFVAPNPVARLYIYNVARSGEVAYDWVSLTRGEPTRAYLNSFSFGERDEPDEQPVMREGIMRWGTPLAGGPLRALFSIYVYRTVREVVELAQRVELDWDVIEGGYTGDSLASPDGREVMRRMDEGDYEVYVTASRLDARLEEEIRAQVEAGAGLVVISGFGRLGRYCDQEDLQVVEGDHYLMRDIPWDYLPRHILNEVRVGQIGAGRVVWLNFPTDVSRVWGIMPVENDHAAWMAREMRYWEYWFAFIGRAIHYAARGESGIELAPAPDRTGVAVTGAPEGATVDVTLRHVRELRWGEPELRYVTQTGPAAQPLTLTMPADAPAGDLLADTIVRDGDGGALAWGTMLISSAQPATIAEIALDREWHEPGGTVSARLAFDGDLPAGASVQAWLVDSWGRIDYDAMFAGIIGMAMGGFNSSNWALATDLVLSLIHISEPTRPY